MLNIHLQYTTEGGIYPVLSTYGFQFKTDHYLKKLKTCAFDVKAIHNNEQNLLSLSCEDEVSYDGCKELHAVILGIANSLQATIDDSDAMLGYSSSGEPVYLINGFRSWTEFLDQAGHRSLEGYTVEIFDGNTFLGRGIFIHSDTATCDDNDQRKIPSCTIISSEGEETFLGDELKVIPITETGF